MADVCLAAMDADFLKRTVGEPLSQALTSIVVVQPTDPIEYIGEALLDYIKRREIETQRTEHATEVARLLQVSLQNQETMVKAKHREEEGNQAKVAIEHEVEAALNEAVCHADIYHKITNVMKERLGASGVQLGRKIVFEGQEVIEFIAASEGREHMIAKELKGLRDGEDPEDGEEEEGVTFSLWKNTETPPPLPPVYDEDGELVPEESEPELIPPEHVLVENVIRDPRVKFFGIPKLGAYLALPVTYTSWLRPGGIIELPLPSQEGSAEEGGQGASGVEEEVGGSSAEGGQAALTPPAEVYGKNEAPVQLALCIDTIGQGRCLSASDIAWAKSWGEKLRSAILALEARMFDTEAALLPSLKGSEVADLVKTITDREEEEVAAALAALAPGTPEDEKERTSKAAIFRNKAKAVEIVSDRFSLMGKLSLAPPADALRVLERALLLLGTARDDLCDTRGALDWPGKMRTVVSVKMLPGISDFRPDDPATWPRALEAKEALESIDTESVRAVNVPALAILEWMWRAITETEDAAAAAEAAAQAEAEAARAEAEARAAEQAAEKGDDEDDE